MSSFDPRKVDPVNLASMLQGFDIVYLDTDKERLERVKEMGIPTFDMSYVSGMASRHYDIAIVVNVHNFHEIEQKEWVAIASLQNIVMDY